MMNDDKIELYDGEQLEDLLCDGLRIIQKKDVFRYGTDAVLLANHAVIPDGAKVLDIGTGTGIIPILLTSKSKAEHLTAMEIQKDMAELAKRNVALNLLQDKIEVICGDICHALDYFPKGTFDAIVTNPPYKRQGCGIINANDSKTIARHEIIGTLDDFIRVSSDLLKQYGHFNMICRPERFADAVESLRKYKLEPKTVTFVHSSIEKPPVMFLLDAVKGGGKNLIVTAPIIL